MKERAEALDRPVLLAVDDLYAVRDRESWDERLSEAIETDLPPVCILACGPTEQCEEFERRFMDPFRVTRFTVSHFAETERKEFIEWFTRRTGKAAGHKLVATKNALLVQVIFELSEGTTLAAFARRFGKRLELSGALAAVQRILSLSALYLETPLEFLAQTDERDAISRLSQDDQRHFRLGAESVDFAHAHLAGEILRPILGISYSLSWEIAWARQLSAVLKVPRDRLPQYTHEAVVNRLSRTPRLSAASRASALRELYESHVSANQGTPAGYLLADWLRALIACPEMTLQPSPIDYALSAIRSPGDSDQFPPEVAIHLWHLGDRTGVAREELDQICWSFLLRVSGRYPKGPSVVMWYLGASSPPAVYRQRGLGWLDDNPQHSQAYALLASLVSDAPTDVGVRGRAFKWLDHNRHHPQVYYLLAPLVSGAPTDVEIRRRALQWLDENPQHPQAYHLLASLVSSAPTDVEVRRRALQWLNENPQHPHAYLLLAPLTKGAPTDTEIRRRALRWLDENPEHPQTYILLAPLASGAPNDVEIRGRAFQWLDGNPGHPQAYQILASLASGALTDVEIRRRAFRWLDDNSQHLQAQELLKSLAACATTDVEIRRRAFHWLDDNPQHPQAHELLRSLVAAAPTDAEIRHRAVAWLDSNPQHPQTAQVLTVLIARSPDDEAEEWITKGILYAKVLDHKSRAGILAVTLARSGARHDLIDQALEFAESSAPGKERGYVLHNLARACAHNPSNALAYIASCSDQQRRPRVITAIAKGILGHELQLPDLVAALDAHPPAIAFEVLGQCLWVGVGTPEFLAFLAQTLNRGFRKPGYGAFLRRLRDYPAIWKGLERNLYSVIRNDFALASVAAQLSTTHPRQK
jgi:hypothetical protein